MDRIKIKETVGNKEIGKGSGAVDERVTDGEGK